MALISRLKRRQSGVNVERLVKGAKKTLDNTEKKLKVSPKEGTKQDNSESNTSNLKEDVVKIVEQLEQDFPTENDTFKDSTKDLLAQLLEYNIPLYLISVIETVDLPTRTNIVRVIEILFQNGYSSLCKLVTVYLKLHAKEIFGALCSAYLNKDVTIPVGAMLRQCLRRKEPNFVKRCFRKQPDFVASVIKQNMMSDCKEVVHSAYETLSVLFTQDDSRECAAAFLVEHQAELIVLSNKVLTDGTLYSKKAILKWLTKLLFERANYEFRCIYVNSHESFKTILDDLRSVPRLKCQALQIVKLFVVNPNKSEEMVKLLLDHVVNLEAMVIAERDKGSEKCQQEKLDLIEALKQLSCR